MEAYEITVIISRLQITQLMLPTIDHPNILHLYCNRIRMIGDLSHY